MNRVREFREKAEMPLFRLAIAIAKSRGWLWEVEAGLRQPKPDDRRRIASILQTDEATVFPPWGP